MSSSSINKAIFYIAGLGFILLAVVLYLAQGDMEISYTELKFAWYFKLGVVGNILISIASILSFLTYRNYFPHFVTICYVALVILVLINNLPEIDDLMKTPSSFYNPRGIGTFVNFGLLFIAGNVSHFQRILKVFYWICICFILAGFVKLGKVGIGAERQDYLYAILNFAVLLIWVFPFFFFQTYPDKKRNLANTIIFFIIFIFVLSTGSRSYVLIYALCILVKFWRQAGSKNGIWIIIITVLAGAVVFFFLTNSGVNRQMDNAFGILSERASEDTRSDQIVEFLAQWKSEYFLQGVGPTKQWYWTTLPGYYSYLDNQLLLLGWWAGLPVLAIYVFLFVRTLFTRSEIQEYKEVYGIKFMVALWILACLGFAVYVNITSELYYFFILILMSYHLCKFSKIENFDPEET